MRSYDIRNFLDRLDRADLIVCVHDRNQRRMLGECALNLIHVNKSHLEKQEYASPKYEDRAQAVPMDFPPTHALLKR